MQLEGGFGGFGGGFGDFATDITTSFNVPQALPDLPSLDLTGYASPIWDTSALSAGYGASPFPALPNSPPTLTGRPAGGGRPFAEGLMNELKHPLKAFSDLLGIGATGFGIRNAIRASGQLGQQHALQKKAQAQAQAAAAPAVAAGTADIQRAQAGQLNPSSEAGIQQWVQQAKAGMAARYASMGLGNSNDLQHENDRIDLMAKAMREELLQREEALGGQLISTGVEAATGAGGLSAQMSQTLAQMIAGANAQLGFMSGRRE